MAVEKTIGEDALRQFEVEQGLATPETAGTRRTAKELGPAKTLEPLPEI